MPPPPQPRPPRLESPTLRPPTTFFPPLPHLLDDPWAAFLVSNTQIERELSTETTIPTPAPKPLPYQKHAKTPIPTPLRDDTAALLAGLCTQDLDYDADLEPDSLQEAGTGSEQASRSFEDDTISDAEFEDVVRDVEQRSSGIIGEGQQMAKESFYDEFFNLSTQELCELVC